MNNDTQIPSTAKELFELLQQAVPQELTSEDYKSFKYVVYARKSTTGDERQEKSIPHQIDECMRIVVNPNGLTLAKPPIEEKGSAKEPDIRDGFNQMIQDIESGKIDGIISWHPDRLSRNMKEAGIIIDLLDKGILKDLRFATSTFENSPTGKMLLGISFVLSKQYSEHLSESVTRGNRKKTEEGIFFDEMKHGYVINKGKLYPDGHNFRIVREIFEKRLEGWSQPEIAKWLNKERSDYRLRKKDKPPSPYKWDKDSVSKVLKDPVYAGVLKYGESYANLEEYYDFTPVVEVAEFFKVNKIKDFSSSKISSAIMSKKRGATKADLLRNVVFCGYCNKSFSSGLTRKALKDREVWYYLYKCETDGCVFKGKSVRAKRVLDYAYDWFDTHVFTTKSNYEHFKEEARQDSIVKAKEINSNIMSLTKLVGEKKDEYTRAKDLISERPDLAKHYDLGTQSARISRLCDLVFSDQGHVREPSGSRRRMRRLTEAQISQLVADREAGTEIKDLASRYNIDRSTVINHLHRAGVPGRRRQGRSLSPDQLQAAGELYVSGLNLIEVGERFDVDRRYLRRVLPGAGFLLRSPGRQAASS